MANFGRVLSLSVWLSAALLVEERAAAVCAPAAEPESGLLVLDMSGEVRRGFNEASDCAAPPAGFGASTADNGPARVSAYVSDSPSDALLPPAAPAPSGSDLGMWASLLAGLGLASRQMRRRRGMQSVSS